MNVLIILPFILVTVILEIQNMCQVHMLGYCTTAENIHIHLCGVCVCVCVCARARVCVCVCVRVCLHVVNRTAVYQTCHGFVFCIANLL